MVKSEKERINDNARKVAKRIATKYKIPQICEKCNSDEEMILCFRDENVLNPTHTNLYYLCKPCNEIRKFSDGRKREDYTRCQICEKIRLCAPSLFDERKICEPCFHKYCKEHGIDEHEILFPVKFTPNGFPETLSHVWFYGRPKFRFKKQEISEEEKQQREEYRKNYQKQIISQVSEFIHKLPIEKIKEMYDQVKDDETRKLFLEQLHPEDKEKLLKLV
ncbi:MAG: hypothetical protein K5793_02790 [Nitrosarchaeum sp.]|nr:hypothetical protein [Nitrosarchaeum sp.]